MRQHRHHSHKTHTGIRNRDTSSLMAQGSLAPVRWGACWEMYSTSWEVTILRCSSHISKVTSRGISNNLTSSNLMDNNLMGSNLISRDSPIKDSQCSNNLINNKGTSRGISNNLTSSNLMDSSHISKDISSPTNSNHMGSSHNSSPLVETSKDLRKLVMHSNSNRLTQMRDILPSSPHSKDISSDRDSSSKPVLSTKTSKASHRCHQCPTTTNSVTLPRA